MDLLTSFGLVAVSLMLESIGACVAVAQWRHRMPARIERGCSA
ncbi:MAG: hypothetical protein WCF79_11810 [Rhodomicrobium sp.]